MEVKSSKIIDVYFFSSHPCGITSIINRIIYGKFIENCAKEKKSYEYKILSGDNFVNLNFHEQSIEVLNNFDIGSENIIIYVYDLNKVKPFDSLNPIYDAIRSILTDNYKKVKIGVIGNKLDLVSQNDLKSIKEIGEKYAEKINAKFLLKDFNKLKSSSNVKDDNLNHCNRLSINPSYIQSLTTCHTLNKDHIESPITVNKSLNPLNKKNEIYNFIMCHYETGPG